MVGMSQSHTHVWYRLLIAALSAFVLALLAPGRAVAGCGDELFIHRGAGVSAADPLAAAMVAHGRSSQPASPCGCKGLSCSPVPVSHAPPKPSPPPTRVPDWGIVAIATHGAHSNPSRMDRAGIHLRQSAYSQSIFHPPR
jgi:hypothetical protein